VTSPMPIVRMLILEGRPPETKRALITELTDAVERTLGVKRESIRVLITEIPPEDWAVGGVLMSEREKHGDDVPAEERT
jgi:4-oxalocrotonate tautomerase